MIRKSREPLQGFLLELLYGEFHYLALSSMNSIGIFPLPHIFINVSYHIPLNMYFFIDHLSDLS